MEKAYAAIGKAVFASQMLEAATIPLFELYKMNTQEGYFQKTNGCLPQGAFKNPIKNILKALSAEQKIAPELEDRFSKYLEDRHTLIHRWLQEKGWPDDGDELGFRPIIELAKKVESEAKELTKVLVGYVIRYGNPDMQEEQRSEYGERMRNLFLRAHIDWNGK